MSKRSRPRAKSWGVAGSFAAEATSRGTTPSGSRRDERPSAKNRLSVSGSILPSPAIFWRQPPSVSASANASALARDIVHLQRAEGAQETRSLGPFGVEEEPVARGAV